jgi:hypothetical protein
MHFLKATIWSYAPFESFVKIALGGIAKWLIPQTCNLRLLALRVSKTLSEASGCFSEQELSHSLLSNDWFQVQVFQ